MRSQSAGRAIFVALFVLALYLMYLIFRPFLPGIVWAIVLAVVFHPLYLRLERLFRGRSWAAATVLSVLVAAVVVVPTVVVVVKVSQGLLQGYEWLEVQKTGPAEAGGAPTDAAELEERVREGLQKRAPEGSALRQWVDHFVDLEALDLREAATSTLKTLGNALMGKTAAVLKNVVSTWQVTGLSPGSVVGVSVRDAMDRIVWSEDREAPHGGSSMSFDIGRALVRSEYRADVIIGHDVRRRMGFEVVERKDR